jgi:tetratricopeptide (TPR) repeat protein
VPSLEDARDLLMAGEYEGAIDAYETIAEDETHTLDAGLGIARCRLQTGQYRKAVDGLSALGATQSADWHYTMARLLRRLGRHAEALSHARAAINIGKRHAGARLLLGDTLELLGRRDEAIDTYRWFEQQLLGRPELPRDAEWVTDTAIGFLRYTVLTQISNQLPQTTVVSRTKHVLHEMLQMAYERLDRTWWPARVAAADLLRRKFNNDPDDGCVADYEAALRINPNLPEAHVGLGEVALQSLGFEEVERRVELALETNSNHTPALHLQAKKLIAERRYRQAKDVCEQALAINPNDVDALSLSAAASTCLYDHGDRERIRTRVAAINPRCARWHRTLGDALSGIRQYAASEKEFRKAIELEPTEVNARTELGMMYMEWGLEDKARDALDGAWELDPFNERTKFTLELLDSLQRFATHESAHFIIRHDAERDPGLGAYVAPYLEGIYEIVTNDYDVALNQKTILEIFPTQREFAVRITGKPWIHTIGACTGRVIALASPRQSVQLMGPYDWARASLIGLPRVSRSRRRKCLATSPGASYWPTRCDATGCSPWSRSTGDSSDRSVPTIGTWPTRRASGCASTSRNDSATTTSTPCWRASTEDKPTMRCSGKS